MSLIEEMFYAWSDGQEDCTELKTIYEKLANEISKLASVEKTNELDDLLMECVFLERLAAYKGGFQQATAIWKECC